MRHILTKKEKILGYLIAVYSAVIFLALWLPHAHDKVAKGFNATEVSIEGVAIALLFAIAVTVGRRIWVGFAGLAIALGPWGKYVILGLPAIMFSAFSGFRYIWQPKDPSATPKRGQKGSVSAKATESINHPTTASGRYTAPKARRKKGAAGTTPSAGSQGVYGSLGRLGPRQGGSTAPKSGDK